MEIFNPEECRFFLPRQERDILLHHCKRKIDEDYLESESRGQKAFGLVAGLYTGDSVRVVKCLPLLKNARSKEPFRQYMNKMMSNHAVPSITPPGKRGWVADNDEMAGKIDKIHSAGLSLLGTYHMHRVAWESDGRRDTPTRLDTLLARDSRLLMLIISMVDPESPIIRCFYEGRIDRELPLIIE